MIEAIIPSPSGKQQCPPVMTERWAFPWCSRSQSPSFQKLQSRNRALAGVVAARHAALRLARLEALECLVLLVRGEEGLAAESHALRLRINPAPCRAFSDASPFELRGDAKDRKDKLGKFEVVSTTGSVIERRPAPARCMSRAITSRLVASRESRSTAWSDDNIAGGEGRHQLLKLRPVGRSASDLLAEHIFASAALSSASWLARSWASVETRA
jgi:hypothetical protein